MSPYNRDKHAGNEGAGIKRYDNSLGLVPTHSNVQLAFTPKFAKIVETFTSNVPFPVRTNSGYRSKAYNDAIYKARGKTPTNSRHTHGDAIDIRLEGLTPEQRSLVLETAFKSGFTSAGFYGDPNLLHVDARPKGRTWGPQPSWAKPVMAKHWTRGKTSQTVIASPTDITANSAPAPDSIPGGREKTLLPKAPSVALTAHDRDHVIRTIIGEAGGETTQGQIAVAHVIRNRVSDSRWGNSATDVVLQRDKRGYHQFSTWNSKDKQGNSLGRSIEANSKAYERVGRLVDSVFTGKTKDNTGGAVNYYAPKGMPNGKPPKWWDGAVKEKGGAVSIGNHIFAGKSNGVTRSATPSQKSNYPDDSKSPQQITDKTRYAAQQAAQRTQQRSYSLDSEQVTTLTNQGVSKNQGLVQQALSAGIPRTRVVSYLTLLEETGGVF